MIKVVTGSPTATAPPPATSTPFLYELLRRRSLTRHSQRYALSYFNSMTLNRSSSSILDSTRVHAGLRKHHFTPMGSFRRNG
jgi:hypothetical protein